MADIPDFGRALCGGAGRKQIENGYVSSVRQPAALCNVSPPVV
jgi:hypothetical protein